MRIYGLKTCDTCRKALKSLPEAEFADVRKDGVPETLLETAFDQFGEKLINMRSTTWRGLSESERDLPPLALLRAHPALMKRPLIVAPGGALYLGWTEATRAALGIG